MTKGTFITVLLCTGALGLGKFFLCILNLKTGNKKQAKLDLVSVILAALCWFSICIKYYGGS
jgi:hypothetical protein